MPGGVVSALEVRREIHPNLKLIRGPGSLGDDIRPSRWVPAQTKNIAFIRDVASGAGHKAGPRMLNSLEKHEIIQLEMSGIIGIHRPADNRGTVGLFPEGIDRD